VVGQGEIDIVHDQDLLISEARLHAEVGLARRFAASVMVPVRVIDTSIRYLDGSGAEVQLVTPGIHHRNEMVSGIGDPMVLGAASGSLGGWRLTARAGLTIPLGRTEEDPFALGDMGIRHQHVQMGTGTVNPVLAAEVARGWGAWRLGAFALTQQVVYENGHGYQAGDRYAGGVALRRRLGARWSVRGGVDAVGETAERWNGMTYADEGNRGRFDLIAGAGASWAATKQLGLDAAIKLPVITRAVGGQLDMPVILEVGASWSFGGPKRGDDHEHEHEHGEHEHEHGDHEHGEHEHGDHGPGERAGDPLHPDTTGLDVADLGKPGEAVDLVPVRGKVTIFDFWATWCEPCKVLEGVLVDLARAHPDVVAIRRVDAADWDSAVVARYLTPKGLGLPHLKIYDPAGRLLLERSSETGKLEELIGAVRALVEAEAAKQHPSPLQQPPPSGTPAAPAPPSPPQESPAATPPSPSQEPPAPPPPVPASPPPPPPPAPRPPPPPPPAAAKAPTFSITVTSKGFEPSDVKVPAGRPVTLRFLRTVQGTCATEVVMEVGGKKLVKDLPLNKPVELTLTFPRPGRTGYACAMDMIRGSITAQ
jgi:thiol-disulfide isomerase/thioredoxin/plastocyanin